MHGTEGVLDERTLVGTAGERGESLRERESLGVVLARLTRVEADVLQQQQLAVFQGVRAQSRALPHRVERELHGLSQQLRETVGDRTKCVLRIRLPLGATQVRGHDDPSTGTEQLREHRQRGTNASVVGYRTVIERDVEVGADQHAPALHPNRDQVVNSAHSELPFRSASVAH